MNCAAATAQDSRASRDPGTDPQSARSLSRNVSVAIGRGNDRPGDRRAHRTHGRVSASQPASRNEAAARKARIYGGLMNDDYLWDKTGAARSADSTTGRDPGHAALPAQATGDSERYPRTATTKLFSLARDRRVAAARATRRRNLAAQCAPAERLAATGEVPKQHQRPESKETLATASTTRTSRA